MTFDAFETGVQSGRPIELFTFELQSGTHLLTNHDEDVVFEGNTYTSLAIGRSNATTVPMGNVREVVVSIPVDVAIAQAIIGAGIPPRNQKLTIRVFHLGDTEARQSHRGPLGAMTVTKDGALTIRVPSAIDLAMNVKLPVVRTSRLCQHVLYSENGCRVDRYSLSFITTVVAISSNRLAITLANDFGNPDQWLRHGEIVRLDDGERRSILDHTGDVITVDVPFRTLAIGNGIDVAPGCDKSPATCLDKFNNISRFGGQPHFPTNNPSSPTGYGVVVQS